MWAFKGKQFIVIVLLMGSIAGASGLKEVASSDSEGAAVSRSDAHLPLCVSGREAEEVKSLSQAIKNPVGSTKP
jgi:hypothetical protein